jgi:hypothetical protein
MRTSKQQYSFFTSIQLTCLTKMNLKSVLDVKLLQQKQLGYFTQTCLNYKLVSSLKLKLH